MVQNIWSRERYGQSIVASGSLWTTKKARYSVLRVKDEDGNVSVVQIANIFLLFR